MRVCELFGGLKLQISLPRQGEGGLNIRYILQSIYSEPNKVQNVVSKHTELLCCSVPRNFHLT